MKYVPLAAAGIALLVSSSLSNAADLLPRMYAKAPVHVDPGTNWTAFYAGVNGGYSWGKADVTLVPGTALAPVRQDVNGGLGGGQIGYNWQVDRIWVLGLEADIQGTGERGSSISQLAQVTTPVVGANLNLVSTTSANSLSSFPWFATLRGRAGILAAPDLLLYGTGGLAVGAIRSATQTTVTTQLFGLGGAAAGPAAAVVGPALSENRTRTGWTLGAGVEKKFDRNWFAKLEYLYLDFGSATYFSGTVRQADVNFHDHILRAGISYAFGPATVSRNTNRE